MSLEDPGVLVNPIVPGGFHCPCKNPVSLVDPTVPSGSWVFSPLVALEDPGVPGES